MFDLPAEHVPTMQKLDPHIDRIVALVKAEPKLREVVDFQMCVLGGVIMRLDRDAACHESRQAPR